MEITLTERSDVKNYRENSESRSIKMGGIYWVDFTGIGSEQKGNKPAVVVQNNIGNSRSPIVKVVPLTSQTKNNLPTHVRIPASEQYGIPRDSTALCEQETVCDKTKVKGYIGSLPEDYMREIAIGMNVNTPMLKYLSHDEILGLANRLKANNYSRILQ